MSIKCPDCKTLCQLGGMTKHGWELLSIKREGGFVIVGSHFEHFEIGGHCHTHRIGVNQFNEVVEKCLKKMKPKKCP